MPTCITASSGTRQRQQDVACGRPAACRAASAHHRRALRARDVDRVQQRRHAADVRDRDHHAVRRPAWPPRPAAGGSRTSVGRQAEPEQARLQVRRHEARGDADAIAVDVRARRRSRSPRPRARRCRAACARRPPMAAALRVILATTSSALSLDVDAAVQRRAADRQLLRQRELELAQAGEAEVAAGAHDRRHRAAGALASSSKLSSSTRSGSSRITSRMRAARRRRRCRAARATRWSRPLLMRSTQKCIDRRVDDAVVVVDHRHPVPLVEGGAGVRDAEADAVADVRRLAGIGRVPAQVGVLVVQRR